MSAVGALERQQFSLGLDFVLSADQAHRRITAGTLRVGSQMRRGLTWAFRHVHPFLYRREHDHSQPPMPDRKVFIGDGKEIGPKSCRGNPQRTRKGPNE